MTTVLTEWLQQVIRDLRQLSSVARWTASLGLFTPKKLSHHSNLQMERGLVELKGGDLAPDRNGCGP